MFYKTKIQYWQTAILYTVANPSTLLERDNQYTTTPDRNGGNDDPSALERPHIVIDRVAAAQLWHHQSTATTRDTAESKTNAVVQHTSKSKKKVITYVNIDSTLFEQARSQLNNAGTYSKIEKKMKIVVNCVIYTRL